MSSFIIERCRSLCEETEVLEKMVVLLFGKLPRDSVTSLVVETAIKQLGKFEFRVGSSLLLTLTGVRIQRNSQEILSLYLDESGRRRREICHIGGAEGSGPDGKLVFLPELGPVGNAYSRTDLKSGAKESLWTNFYDSVRLATASSFSETAPPDLERRSGYSVGLRCLEELVVDAVRGVGLEDIFVPEEDFGRRLYLEEHYSGFVNLKKLRSYREATYISGELERLRRKGGSVESPAQAGIVFEEMDFDSYLKTFDKFSSIPRYFKYGDVDYDEYTRGLLGYLRGFFLRTHPLLDQGTVEAELSRDFEQVWESGALIDWRVPTCEMPYYSRPFDRLFFSEGTFNSHLGSRHYKREDSRYSELSDEEKERRRGLSLARDKEIARTEFLIGKFSQLLSMQRREAIDHVNKLQSSTLEELELDKQLRGQADGLESLIAELQESVSDRTRGRCGGLNASSGPNPGVADSDSEDDFDQLQEKAYNPLKLPLGPDGRPMPYWLYKLNGLGVEFKCEICGNCSYWGRRAFERHFSESKHANGLSALGIPNTSHFKEITRISDAQELYSTLCKQARDLSFDDQSYVEMEDSQGNILPLKSFQDLHRQGLI